MRRAALLALALVTPSALGAAKANGGQGKKYLDAAVKLYGAFEFERALAQLDKARKQSEGAEMDVTIALYTGIVQQELGHDDAAESEFKTALSLDANAVLPTRVSPKVQQLFDGLKAQMNKSPDIKTPAPDATPTPTPAPEPVSRPRPAVQQSSGSAPKLWWAPGAAGVLVAAAGVVLLFEAKSMNDALAHGSSGMELDPTTALSYRSNGKTFQALSFTGIAVGAACVVASAVIFLLGPKLGWW